MTKVKELVAKNEQLEKSLKRLSKENIEKVLNGLFNWISREHTLIDARLQWSILTNTMIFVALGALLQMEGDVDISNINYFIPLFIAGFLVSISFMIPILLGLRTINVLRAREKYIYSQKKDESYIFRLIDPEEKFDTSSREKHLMSIRAPSDWDFRSKNTHKVAMFFHVLISVGLTLSWSLYSIVIFPIFTQYIPLCVWIPFILIILSAIILITLKI